MDERIMQLRVGLMVLFVAAIIGFLLFLFSGEGTLFQLFRPKQVFYIQFPRAPGVTRDTPVQKSGIRIGRVSEVRLAQEVSGMDLDPSTGVVVTVEIEQARKVFSDEVCVVKRNLLGDAVLEFVRAESETAGGQAPASPGGAASGGGADADSAQGPSARSDAQPGQESRQVLPSGAVLRGKVQADPIQVVGNLEEDLSTAIQSVARTSDEIRSFVENAGEFLGTDEELAKKQQRLRDILDTSRQTMLQVQQLAANANDVIGDENVRQDIKDAVAQFPGVIKDARGTLNQMSHTFETMDETVRRVNVSLGNVERFAQRLDEQGGTMIERLNRSSETLELLMGELLTLTQALNSQEGTLGRLIRDPEVYEDLRDAVRNIEDVSRRLRPVVDNATILSDKLARHPELLGVRGALRQSPGTKGVPQLRHLRGAVEPRRAQARPPFAPTPR